MKTNNCKLKIAIAVIAFAMIALGGCATCPKDCPSQEVIYMVETPFGPMPVKMKKGFLNPDKQDENWVTLEEYERRMEESGEPDKEQQITVNE